MNGLGNFIKQEGTQALEKGLDDSCSPTQWLACLLATKACPCDPRRKEAEGGVVVHSQTVSLAPLSRFLASSHLRILLSGLGIAGETICDLSGPGFPDDIDAFHACCVGWVPSCSFLAAGSWWGMPTLAQKLSREIVL